MAYADPGAIAFLGKVQQEAFDETVKRLALLSKNLQVTYSLPERRTPLAAPTIITAPVPVSNIKVVEQLVGGTVVRLENGDVLNIRLFVDSMVLNVDAGAFEPRYRIVPEVVMGGQPGGMQHDVEPGEVRN